DVTVVDTKNVNKARKLEPVSSGSINACRGFSCIREVIASIKRRGTCLAIFPPSRAPYLGVNVDVVAGDAHEEAGCCIFRVDDLGDDLFRRTSYFRTTGSTCSAGRRRAYWP